MAVAISDQTPTTLSADLQRLQLFLADRIQASFTKAGLTPERTPENIRRVQERCQSALEHKGVALSADERQAFMSGMLDEVLGFGPIDHLLQDDTVTEVMVNGPQQIYVERDGKTILDATCFLDDDHVQRIINKIVQPLGRSADRKSPLVDARLPDGSRVNAVVGPCAIDGPSITIRKFPKERLGVADLIRFGSTTEDMAAFLEACVVAKLNIVVSGGTGSGKTTLLNIMSGFIPEGDRIVTIEDAAELSLQQPHVVRLETRHSSDPTEKDISIRDLVKNSLRMRPERIVIGECRGGEALDMLQAMNTGHDGSLTTVHANSPRDSITRLETLVLMAGVDMPLTVVRRQIASAVHLIVQQARLRDGSRKITQITEVTGMEGDNVVMQDVFRFEDEGEDDDGKVKGHYKPTGLRPYYSDRLKTHGYNLPASFFMQNSGVGPGAGGGRGRFGGRRR